MRVTTKYGEFSSPEDYDRHIEEAVNGYFQAVADRVAEEQDREEGEEVYC